MPVEKVYKHVTRPLEASSEVNYSSLPPSLTHARPVNGSPLTVNLLLLVTGTPWPSATRVITLRYSKFDLNDIDVPPQAERLSSPCYNVVISTLTTCRTEDRVTYFLLIAWIFSLNAFAKTDVVLIIVISKCKYTFYDKKNLQDEQHTSF